LVDLYRRCNLLAQHVSEDSPSIFKLATAQILVIEICIMSKAISAACGALFWPIAADGVCLQTVDLTV
jgi:hypothetical protein